MNKFDYTLGSLVIRHADSISTEQRKDIAAWLRRQAKNIMRTDLALIFRAKYIVDIKAVDNDEIARCFANQHVLRLMTSRTRAKNE